ncbi:hypothetical protein [Pedobacter sp. ASV12]|uniref:hypothetical protein n=1 Tax=Pedobacter sp. ASV12 TaxID=2795120 RepID=UPI0018ECE115|nr:hypothetical protein [Pedobacter sp. ASV12]
MLIDKAIKTFATFMDNSWAEVSELLVDRDYTSNESAMNDWLQSNWELLIKRKVLKINNYLEVYGDGADFNGSSSRITDPNSLANFRIKAIPKTGNSIFDVLNEEEVMSPDLVLDRLVGFRDGFYVLEPEFNHVLLNDENMDIERVARLNDVVFVLEEL